MLVSSFYVDDDGNTADCPVDPNQSAIKSQVVRNSTASPFLKDAEIVTVIFRRYDFAFPSPYSEEFIRQWVKDHWHERPT